MALSRFAGWNIAWISAVVAVLVGASLITYLPAEVRATDTADASQPDRPIVLSDYLSGTMYQFLLAEPVVAYRHAVVDWFFQSEFFDYVHCHFTPPEFDIRLNEWRTSMSDPPLPEESLPANIFRSKIAPKWLPARSTLHYRGMRLFPNGVNFFLFTDDVRSDVYLINHGSLGR